MTAAAIQIADAMVTELNGHDFSKSFDAVRAYRPSYKLEDMGTLHVTVVPAEFSGEPADRLRDREEHPIHVAVQQRFEVADGGVPLAALDGLMELCEEIRDFFRGTKLSECPAARRIKTETKPIFDPEHLQKYDQFTSVLVFTYQIVR